MLPMSEAFTFEHCSLTFFGIHKNLIFFRQKEGVGRLLVAARNHSIQIKKLIMFISSKGGDWNKTIYILSSLYKHVIKSDVLEKLVFKVQIF